LRCDDKWATLVLTITAFFGKMLTPILVSKGMPEGHIATWILPHIHADTFKHVSYLLGWMR